jgi:DNA-binding response OmpR family regulator
MSILVVEDDPDLLAVLRFVLEREGHEVFTASDGAAGIELWKVKSPSLVILDMDLPKDDGWRTCQEIRRGANTPIVMLAAAAEEADVVRGFESGADDYVTKPFSFKQFALRVGRLLHRSEENVNHPRAGMKTIRAGDITLDPRRRTVYRGGLAIRLSPMESRILYELMLEEDKVLSYRNLTDRVWGYEDVDDTGPLKTHIHNLRLKFEVDATSPGYIRTVPGVGYAFSRNGSVAR